jgi:hypothetical protein
MKIDQPRFVEHTDRGFLHTWHDAWHSWRTAGYDCKLPSASVRSVSLLNADA